MKIVGRKRDYEGEIYWGYHVTPFGTILVGVTDKRLCWLQFVKGDEGEAYTLLENTWQKSVLIRDVRMTLPFYEQIFWVDWSFELLLYGTDFDLRVWEVLLSIPCGGVVSYEDVACSIGRREAVRAVGGAVGRNDIAIVVPCHRVVRKGGRLGGYGGGLERKRRLLEYEGVFIGD